MLHKLRSHFQKFKWSLRATPSKRQLREENAFLRRRNNALFEENMELAAYNRFLTDQCIAFDLDRLIRQVERGQVIK